MTDEINDTSDDMVEGEFVLNEFVDRYGPRLAHLNGVIQVLAQIEQRAESGEFAAARSTIGGPQFATLLECQFSRPRLREAFFLAHRPTNRAVPRTG